MTHALAALPAAAVEMGRASSALVWGYYLLLLLASLLLAKLRNIIDLGVLWLSRLRGPLQDLYSIFERTPKKLIILPLLILVLPVSIAAVNLPDRELHISFLDVGEGDATLIQIGGQNVLIDGGPDSQAVVRGLGRKMKFWQKDIDLMVLTHPHLDHLTGLVEVLRRYNVKRVLAPALTAESPVFSEWQTRTEGIPRIEATPGQILNLAGGARLTVLNAGSAGPGLKDEDMENLGLVLRLSMGDVSVLLTADVDQHLENTLISNRAELSSTILKVSHHGSNTASSSQFLALVDPRAAVISVGADNRFGHPDPAVIKRLTNELGSAGGIYRTDLSGTIEFTSDSRRLWVKSERP
jgi:competence protein ComEC